MISKRLKRLLKLAKGREISDEERKAQRISWAYGNVKMSNEKITRALVEEMAGSREKMKGEE